MEQILEALTNRDSDKSDKSERVDDRDKFLDKYTIKPLTPNISSDNCTISDDNSHERKDELLTRLTYTSKRLNRCEQSLDKNWSIDTLRPDAEDASSQKGEVLPRNVEENIRSIIRSTQEYVVKLNRQLKDLDDADQQVSSIFVRFHDSVSSKELRHRSTLWQLCINTRILCFAR